MCLINLDEKINTGVRIIEIKITSEEDIEDIISNLRIEGERDSDCHRLLKDYPKVVFFNFKSLSCYPPEYFRCCLKRNEK